MTKTLKLKNIVMLLILSLVVSIIATALPNTFADDVYIGQDDSTLTPVAHLESRLVAIEAKRRVLNTEINEMESGSIAFETAIAELASIDDEIETINSQMNQIWAAYNRDDVSEDVSDDEEHSDDLYELGYEYYEPFSPFFEEPPVRMSDAEIAIFADVAIGVDEVEVHEINSAAQLRGFLNGTLGNNNDHFRLMGNINVVDGSTGFLTTGRPGVFTGIFDGNGYTITNLRLRAARTPAVAGIVSDAAVGVGLFQQA